jgi:predicted enzyme related to lactoylglutathione lyase
VIEARFGHVSIVASEWRALADFYARVLGCTFVPPERDLGGPVLEAATGVSGATIRGAHLRLPGLGPDGPTLEIFEYGSGPERPPTAVNRPGFGHIAFAVPDVAAARDAVLAAGGGVVGEVVTTDTSDGRRVTWTYVTDPEGNVLELQAWSDVTG